MIYVWIPNWILNFHNFFFSPFLSSFSVSLSPCLSLSLSHTLSLSLSYWISWNVFCSFISLSPPSASSLYSNLCHPSNPLKYVKDYEFHTWACLWGFWTGGWRLDYIKVFIFLSFLFLYNSLSLLFSFSIFFPLKLRIYWRYRPYFQDMPLNVWMNLV